MANNITFNGRTAVHAGSNGTLTTSDICGVPPFCVPIPFTNIAKSADAAKTCKSITVNGFPLCNNQSIFAVSSGDEPGTCGGVNSGTIKGPAEFITFSGNIFAEGFPVVRAGDMMVSNNRNTPPAPLVQPGVGKPPKQFDANPSNIEAGQPHYTLPNKIVGDEIVMLKSRVISEAAE